MSTSPKRLILFVCLVAFLLCVMNPGRAAQQQQQRQERPPDPALVQSRGQTSQQAPAQAAAPRGKQVAVFPDENVSTTTHTIMIGGKPFAYTAVAGTLLLKADDGRPRANFYFTAYFRDDVKDKSLPAHGLSSTTAAPARLRSGCIWARSGPEKSCWPTMETRFPAPSA